MSTSFMLFILAFVVVSLAPRAIPLTQGNLTTDNFSSNPDTRIRFVDPKIGFAQAGIAPITVLMEKMDRMLQAAAKKVEWVEETLGTPTTTANGASLAASGTLDVAAGTGSMFTANDIIQADLGAGAVLQLLVTARATDTLTVTRAWGSTADADIPDGAVIKLLSSAYVENGTSGTGVALTPTMPYNIMQIHRTPIDLSRSNLQILRYNYPGKDPIKKAQRDAMIIHREKKERAFLVGELKVDSSTHRSVSQGVLPFITTNRSDCLGSFTKKKYDSHLKAVMTNGTGEWWQFASGTFLEALNQEVLTNSNMQITPATKEWGIDIRKYLSPFGIINIVYHRVLSQILESAWGGCGLTLDMTRLTNYYLQRMILKENIQANDADGRKDEYLEECTLGLMNEANHGFIYNA